MKKLILIFFAIATSTIYLLVAQAILKFDPAAGIAAYIPFLSNGAVLAGLLGGLLATWLAFGDAKRTADFGGWQLGVLAGYLVWLWGQPHVWRVEVVIRAAFGDNNVAATVFTNMATIGVLFAVMRYVALWVSGWFEKLIEAGEQWEVKRNIRAEIKKLEMVEAEGQGAAQL